MKAVTIRGVDSELAEKLKTTAKKQGKSVNQL
jgi:predicted HicB family RNase H-like nuclease